MKEVYNYIRTMGKLCRDFYFDFPRPYGEEGDFNPSHFISTLSHFSIDSIIDSIDSATIGLKEKDVCLLYKDLLKRCFEYMDIEVLEELKLKCNSFQKSIGDIAVQKNDFSLLNCSYDYIILGFDLDEFYKFIKFVEAGCSGTQENIKEDETSYEEFTKLFKPQYIDKIPSFMTKLRECDIIKDGAVSASKNKTYLCQLMIYLFKKNILRIGVSIPSARIFYSFFRIKVRQQADKNDPGVVAERSITDCVAKEKDPSKKDLSDFYLCCSCFFN
ncbi:hypothetical protein [uncultured Bacteroides sp.]|uniref:hypothetical protein n=1 Tax=uncultured Bacteroides sp. TaxID=162156 RepID=UPI002AAA8949|nr:hypothetical protein [uncultured Bacteroides sp.]